MEKNNTLWGLQGKHALITGASRGIGKCLKENFQAAGAVVFAPERSEMDLSDIHSIEKYVDGNCQEIDVFIHCAGINLKADVEHLGVSLVNGVFQVNTLSAVEIIKGITPYMKRQGWGRILLISSLYAIVARERRAAYSMSKNALTGLAKTLSLELAPMSILTNCIAPGYVLTEMTKKNLSKTELERIIADIPTGRLQTEQEIADIAMFLCSNFNQSITGQLIAIDGGFICK